MATASASESTHRRAPVLDGATLLSAIKDRVAFPDDVKRVELRFENDSSGEPAVWIVMFVEDDLKPAKEKITRLREAGQKAKEVVYDCDLGVWPYFQIDTV